MILQILTHRAIKLGIMNALVLSAACASFERGVFAADITATLDTNNDSTSFTLKELPSEYYGLNGMNTVDSPTWAEHQTSDSFTQRVASYRPQLIRYPGGTVANYWDWLTGNICGASGTQSTSCSSSIVKNSFRGKTPGNTLDVMSTVLENTGAKSLIYVMNMITSNREQQRDMLDYARSISLPVKYIELGNEFYQDGDADTDNDSINDDYKSKYSDGSAYADDVVDNWSGYIRVKYPDVKIAIVGNDTKSNVSVSSDGRTCSLEGEESFPDKRDKCWNLQVLKRLKYRGAIGSEARTDIKVDAITIHAYAGGGNGGEPECYDEILYPKFSDRLAVVSTALPKILSNTYNKWNMVKTDLLPLFSNSSYGLKTWITEYNYFSRYEPIHGSWSHGLYGAAMTLLYLEDPIRVPLIELHDVVNGAIFGTLFENTTAFNYAGTPNAQDMCLTVPWPTPLYDVMGPAPATKLYGRTAIGVGLETLSRALLNVNQVQRITFNPDTNLTDSTSSTAKQLLGFYFKNTDGSVKHAVVLNLSSAAKTISLRGVFGSSTTFTYQQRDGQNAPLKLVTDQNGMIPAYRSGTSSDVVSIPGYSITNFSN